MIESHTEISQMASRYALACRLRRVLAWLTQIIYFMAHAENAENADFASRYALAASGMYTLGETPTHASLRCVLREISWTSQAQALRDLCETIISEKGTANATDGKHKRSECASVLSALSV